ncbi:MAG: response regulator [Thermodesulfobacteriota bacterium]
MAEHQEGLPEEETLRIRVLIADDEATVGNVLAEIIRAEGHSVELVYNGIDAVERLRRETVDLVITDYAMPGCDGLEVLRQARQLCPQALVVIITGFASVENALQAVQEGAYHFLRKPFNLEEIRIIVRQAAERIRLQRENRQLRQDLESAVETLSHLGQQDQTKAADVVPDAVLDVAGALWAGQSLPPSYYRTGPGSSALLADLETLVRLRRDGFLSEEEFGRLKRKLIDQAAAG